MWEKEEGHQPRLSGSIIRHLRLSPRAKRLKTYFPLMFSCSLSFVVQLRDKRLHWRYLLPPGRRMWSRYTSQACALLADAATVSVSTADLSRQKEVDVPNQEGRVRNGESDE